MTESMSVRGHLIPSFMYGTAWKEDRTEDLVTAAIGAGFRAIDTANQRKHYFEEGVGAAVAAAIEAGTVERSELFLQTKFTYQRGQDHRLPYDPKAAPGTQVAQSFASSLEHLQTSYVDAYVLHGPATPFRLTPSDEEVWRAMQAEAASGKIKLLGVSNVSLEQLEQLQALADVKPAFVQNRCYARHGWDREVRAFCRANDIVYQGFSLLTANRRELNHSVIARIAERAGATVSQLVFKFARDVGMLPLTGTTDRAHMVEDLACMSIAIAPEDLKRIENIASEA
jgi:diketogulonate reductase-like aldo/keto reductase